MRLRNKNTGEIGVLNYYDGKIQVVLMDAPLCGNSVLGEYETLAELNNDWEDYATKDPLIKDEKIRKAVRAWAEANNITQVSHDACWNAFRCTDFVIAFDYDFDRHDGFEDMKTYTIDELCGEEEK